ncbi:amino acid adenylation domain-containing protein [Tenacibaculum sp. MAR_2009_124]|uniref:class I adenylate-forming enzyme family protein n=1 Tax=Tenacibaculum sp. MAR_2009_124 TaxID=1250059 RepID=UPI000899F164|nr:class I adenylate-forming enzyme family protein [Tenacibaculum sp. MAR_2009_124]SEB49559.1 amino acid adenylation domain-containing protein [Tenacibaculum sp. MAR_2009_124]
MITQLYQLLDRSAANLPNKTAVTYGDTKFTFKDIEEKSNQLTAYLQSIGVKRGDRIIILFGNTIETVISFWSILKAGAIVIPLSAELKPDKIDYIINDSQAKVLFTNQIILEENLELLGNGSLEKVIVPKLPESLRSNFVEGFESAISNASKSFNPVGNLSVDLASIIYTSGSTGEPKGVMLTHQNMITATHSLNTYLGYNSNDKVLCVLPLSFDYGLYQMIMSISTGANLLLEKESTWPIFLLKKIEKEKATILPAVPTLVTLLHDQDKNKKFNLSSIRKVTNTGAALTRTNIKMVQHIFENAEIFSMYGLTECKRCTYLPPEDIDKKLNSVGIAIPNTELWLVDENDHKIEEANTIGQLVIRGATVMRGYWNKPEKTAEKLKDGPIMGEKVLYTGDYCSLDEDGYLYFKGRMDHIIKSRGIKVSPKEVEDFIGTIEEVNSVAIVGVPHSSYGDVLYAFVVLKDGMEISEDHIKGICKNNLEAFKVPEYISIISSLPKTINGKFDLIGLKERALSEVEQMEGKVKIS